MAHLVGRDDMPPVLELPIDSLCCEADAEESNAEVAKITGSNILVANGLRNEMILRNLGNRFHHMGFRIVTLKLVIYELKNVIIALYSTPLSPRAPE